MKKTSFAFLAVISIVLPGVMSAKPKPAPTVVTQASPEILKPALIALEKAQYKFTPEVKSAYLACMKEQAKQKLAAMGKAVPDDLLAWVDSDPAVQATVYGNRLDPAGVLLMLRTLELDLGQEAVRKKYTQLALAAAIVFAKDGNNVNLAPRPPVKLAIGGDPRKPVNTKDPNRTLDLNDHIINFLNDNTIEEDVVVGQKEELPELKYDAKGVAIPAPKTKGKPKMVPVTEKRTRSLYAADVLASTELQKKFNAYMKEKGQNVSIDCGEKVVHWNSHDMVHGEQHKKIAEAFNLFKAAYEAKGLLPAQRDPFPTPGERCAYIIRNNEYQFPADLQAQRKWPRYPLTSPWPTLTLLVDNNQPLREREERWEAFRDKGEFKGYGEYIGGVAQQFDMQSARRIKPYPFTYGSIQMMLKDGGVCGTMGNIAARSWCTLGVPSCTAGQPGHCALILFAIDPKTNTYKCHGAQYATGGDDKTHPHTPWFFGDDDSRHPMVYHQSVAWAVNYGFQAFLDSCVAYSLYRQLPEADRQGHGMELLQSGLAVNPFNFLLVDAAYALAKKPADAIAFWKHASKLLAGVNKPGCPNDALYALTVREKLFASITKLPVPAEAAAASEVYAFLKQEKCDNAATLAMYKLAVEGLPSLLNDTRTALKAHLESARTVQSCQDMTAAINAAAERIADKKKRRDWALECWQDVQGHECFLVKGAITPDPTVAALAKLSGQKPQADAQQYQPVLNQIVTQLKTDIAGGRTPKGCTQLAHTIDSVAKQLTDAAQRQKWLEELAQVIKGKEEFTVKNGKPQHDPCADTIKNLQATPAPEAPKK